MRSTLKKYSRRAFLGLGAAATADAAWESSGGTGLVRIIANILSPNNIEWELPLPIKTRDYVVDEDEEIKECIRPDVESLLNSLYEGEPLSPYEVANQVALVDTIISIEFDAERSEKEGKPIIKSDHKYGQAILLPFKEGGVSRYFFVTAYHNFKDLENKTPVFHIDGKLFFPRVTFVHSEDSDLAFGYCSGSDPINVKTVSF